MLKLGYVILHKELLFMSKNPIKRKVINKRFHKKIVLDNFFLGMSISLMAKNIISDCRNIIPEYCSELVMSVRRGIQYLLAFFLQVIIARFMYCNMTILTNGSNISNL